MSTTDQRTKLLLEALRRLDEFDRTRMAYRAEDVNRYFLALAAGKKVSRPEPIKL